jgi:myosin heavy subunit
VKVHDTTLLDEASALLGIEEGRLEDCFCSRSMKTCWGGEEESVRILLSPEQAQDACEALLKTLYSHTFNWILRRINTVLAKQLHSGSGGGGGSASSETDIHPLNIHVLDIFGFEVFARNGLGQLCINYCNEMLQV